MNYIDFEQEAIVVTLDAILEAVLNNEIQNISAVVTLKDGSTGSFMGGAYCEVDALLEEIEQLKRELMSADHY